MQIDLIFRIASIGIVVAILNQVLAKVDRSEYAVLTTLMGIIAVLFLLIPEIESLFETVKTFIDY
ncbi:MAG: stage III sporulation protein AC [Clostridia bacterium]